MVTATDDLRLDAIHASLDALDARIERVFWAVIAVGFFWVSCLVATMLTLVFRLTS